MSIAELNTCPRKAFLHSAVESGVIKASILRGIMKDILLSNPFNISEKELQKKIRDAFDAKAGRLLPFEAEAEEIRMNILLWRYLQFEQHQTHKVLSENFAQQGHGNG